MIAIWFSYDKYKKIRQSKMFLANPQKNYIGVLSGVKDVVFKPSFNTLSEISFNIYKVENGVKNKYYDKVEIKRLVEVQYLGWFQIQNVVEKGDGLTSYKEVECLSLENSLVSKKIDDINGVFSLYDTTDTNNSLLHIVAKETGWKVGHVSNELLGKWRTFAVDSVQVYNFLTQDVSESFDCVFQFDTYDKRINAYKLSEIGDLTDIVISYNNILKEWIHESNADSIVTKLKVTGGDNVDIRAVNPTGANYLINVDYFKTTEWMTQSLIDALNNYQAKYNSIIDSHTTTLSLLKQYQEELTVLKTELVDLQSKLKAEQHVQGTFVSQYSGTPPYGSSEYGLYMDAVNKINDFTRDISIKKSEIKSKEIQIENVRVELGLIGEDLDVSSNFTKEQLDELNEFLTENEEYNDPTFVVTDTMTDDEITDIKLELMENGANELKRVSRPRYTIKTSASNIFTIVDNKEGLSYEKWKEKLVVGNLVSIRLRNDFFITVRLIKMEIDFNNPEGIELTFSNASRLDDGYIQLGELQAQAGRTATTLSLSKFGWDEASKLSSPVREFITGTLNATTNTMVNNDNQEIVYGEFGIQMRKWLPDQNKYSDYGSWWNNNTLLFSSDGFQTANTAIGLLTAPDGEEYYGVATDVLVGNLILGSQMNITNNSGTYTIGDNGIQASKDGYAVTINPNTPSEIFKISVGGEDRLYVDTEKDELVYSGTLLGADGTFSGTLSGGTITGSTIYGTEFLSSNWDGNTHGTWFNELTINGGKIRLGRTMYAPDGRTYEGQTTLSSGLIKTYRIEATYVGNRDNYIPYGYFSRIDAGQVYLNGEQLVSFKNNNVTAIYTPNKLHYIHLNDKRELLPSTFNSTTPFSLGNSSYPFRNIYVENVYSDNEHVDYGNINYLTTSRFAHKSGGALGFFGRTPTSINTVTKLSTAANTEQIAAKVNTLLDALGNTTGGYGLIKLS